MTLVPAVTEPEPEDRCTCGVRMWQGREERVVRETCPEHGRWARWAKKIEAASEQNP